MSLAGTRRLARTRRLTRTSGAWRGRWRISPTGGHGSPKTPRIAAIGNSGGGTLTLFLAALSPDLCAIASSGYPSTFEFIARKEKKHCHCNLLPGVVGQIEMWQLYGLFAPRPLFLCQGDQDSLFPSDLFFSTARKVKTAYDAIGTAAGFRSNVFSGEHPWDTRRRFAIGSFLAEAIGLRAAESLDNDSAGDIATPCLDAWPTAALSTDDLARHLTGKNPTANARLSDVFRPRIDPAAAVTVTPPTPAPSASATTAGRRRRGALPKGVARSRQSTAGSWGSG